MQTAIVDAILGALALLALMNLNTTTPIPEGWTD